jgi:SAM-dependent methyltransferase
MYDQFASDYDRFVNWMERLAVEMPFLEKQLAALPKPAGRSLQVLDAACGTAMHAVALARLGYEVSAADLSQPMIEKARINASAAGVDVKLKAVGFGSLASAFGNNSFDAVLCLGNSLPHVLSVADLKAALQDFAACLRPGGLLLIQNRNFDAVMMGKQRWMEPQAHSENGSEWIFFRYYDYLPDGLIDFNIVTATRDAQGNRTASVATTQLRPQLFKEMNETLLQVGFKEIHTFGSLQGELFVPLNSGNLVITA